jgi:CRISPR-associated protein Csm2
MVQINFWKDKREKVIDPTLYSAHAARLSADLARECKEDRKRPNKRTQIRKFYDEVARLEASARAREGEWPNILPMVHMLTAKAAYARGRDLVSDRFLEFIRSAVNQVQDLDDLSVFANFFEAFMGFYRMDCPAN